MPNRNKDSKADAEAKALAAIEREEEKQEEAAEEQKELEEAIAEAEATKKPHDPDFPAIDRKIFFDKVRIRPFGGVLKQQQVDGMNAILDFWEAEQISRDLRWLAYPLATTFLETNRTMQAVREAYWLSENWRKKNLRYYPFYGRGLVQLTWEENYRKMGKIFKVDLVGNPDLALDPDLAVKIMFEGMTKGESHIGDFTNLSLEDFFSDTKNDALHARRIINAMDRADEVAGWHTQFLEALTNVAAPPVGLVARTPVAT
jgi:hypothetical protein